MTIQRVYDFFSMKYIIPRDKTTKAIKSDSIFRAIQNIEYSNEIEAVKNFGGDAPGPWMIEGGQPDPSLTMEVTEISKGMYSAFENSTVTENSAETSGSVGTFSNTSGTSIYDGSNGISAVAVSTTNYANLKAGSYIFKKGTLATDINIYVAGLVSAFDDTSGLMESDVDCSTPGSVEVASLGITLTVAGTANFGSTDVAVLEDVRPANQGSNQIVVGNSDNPSELMMTFVMPKQSTGDIYYIDMPRVWVPGGLAFGAATREFSTMTINASPLVSSDNSLYTMNQIFTSSPNT